MLLLFYCCTHILLSSERDEASQHGYQQAAAAVVGGCKLAKQGRSRTQVRGLATTTCKRSATHATLASRLPRRWPPHLALSNEIVLVVKGDASNGTRNEIMTPLRDSDTVILSISELTTDSGPEVLLPNAGACVQSVIMSLANTHA